MSIDSSISLSPRVAAEIRAWMGRLDVRQSELARRLGQNDEWLSSRLKGPTPINLNDLQRIATALGVAVVDLFPRDMRVPTAGLAGDVEKVATVRRRIPLDQRVIAKIDYQVNGPMVPTPRRAVRLRSDPAESSRRPVTALARV